MGLKIHLGGKLVDEADAKISVFDHGLLYGMALVTFTCGFTVMWTYRHHIPGYVPATMY